MSEVEAVETEVPEKKKMSSAERVRRMNAAKAAKKAAKAVKDESANTSNSKTDKFEYAARVNCVCGKRLAKLRGESMYSCMRVWMDEPTTECQRYLPEKDKAGNWLIFSESNVHLAPKSKREEADALED